MTNAITLVTVTFAIDTSSAQKGFEESFIADCVNESFRGLQRQFNSDSCIMDYAIDGIRPSSATIEGYEEGDAFTFMDERLPTAVLETDGSAIHCVRSTLPMRIVLLDGDTESGDQENVKEVNGEEVYVTDRVLSAPAVTGQDGVDAGFVDGVLSQLATACTVATAA